MFERIRLLCLLPISGEMKHTPKPLAFVAIASVVIGLLCPLTVSATPITITNYNFEDDNLADGAHQIGAVPTGWTGTSWGGQLNPSSSWGPGGSNSDFVDTSASGGELGTMDGPTFTYAFTSNVAYLEQTLSETLAANTTYTLTAAFFRRMDAANQNAKSFTLELLTETSGTTIASITANPVTFSLPEGTFSDITAIGTTGVAPTELGENLVIRISGLNDGSYLDVDNVRLDATAVPEPSSFILVGMGLLGSLMLWRRLGNLH